jgi:hypothetical protein
MGLKVGMPPLEHASIAVRVSDQHFLNEIQVRNVRVDVFNPPAENFLAVVI